MTSLTATTPIAGLSLAAAFPGWPVRVAPWTRELTLDLFQQHQDKANGLVTIVEVLGDRGGKRATSKPGESARATAALPVGAIVDKYRVEEVLGHGAFATVYRATHLILQKLVALKVLHRHLLKKDPRFVDLLCEESRHTAQLDHPNVVRVFDVTRSNETTYIVLEWVDGTTLSRVVRRRGCLPAAAAIRVASDVAAGLEAALGRGLVHRDIKPANVLMLREGGAKIIDLGLARHSLSKHSALGRDAVVGTPGYMAPEQAVAPRSVDLRADIYSLGATLYFALTGRPPFRVKTVEEVSRMSPQDRPRPVRTLAPDTPPALAELVEAMLRYAPADRPASYGEVRERLLRLG